MPGRQVDAYPEGPPEKEGFINLEGMDDPFRFSRLHSPQLGLVTYLPHDWLAELVHVDAGHSVVVWANYQGQHTFPWRLTPLRGSC
ncbi:MAG: hypothetical protein AB1445_14020 [Bacillota bacterium]